MIKKAASSNHGLSQLVNGKFCQPSSKWVPLTNQRRKKQRKERDGLRLSYTMSKTQWVSSPTAP